MLYSEAFEKAFNEVLVLEGVFSNDKYDAGGKTKYGISQRFWDGVKHKYPDMPDSVEKFTPGRAKRIYLDQFWEKLQLDFIPSQLITTELFEASVNCGPETATKMLQEACNYNRLESWPKLVVDGKLGPQTAEAVIRLLEHGYEVPLFKAMNGEQYIYYKKLGDQHHSRGWTRRLPG